MPELIDREQAGKNICKYCASNEYCKEDDCMVYRGLRDTPTIQIEAEPVRHGRWIKSDVYTFKKCSECGAIWDAALCENIFFIYCPRCGSKNGGADNG